MNMDLNKITAAAYFSEIFNAGIDGYIKMFRDMAEHKTNCTDPLLWIGAESNIPELLDAMDHFMTVAEEIALEILNDEQTDK
ncbi:MAG: hypothetical protein J7497_16300 [Chitinophagaceae bacterium]|nr:hypothetical protein [Chitinophagaceae bacterium]